MRISIRLLTVIGLITAVSSVLWAAPKLSPPPVPKFFHAEYSWTWIEKAISTARRDAMIAEIEKESPPYAEAAIAQIRAEASDRVTCDAMPVGYWVSAPRSTRLTIYAKNEISSFTDGTNHINFCKAPGGSYMQIGSFNRNDPSNRHSYLAGTAAEQIPFLGFQQPGKVYKSGKTKIIKTSGGWVERCRVPHEWRTDLKGKPEMLDAALTYDLQGRLVRFQRDLNAPGIYHDTYDYKDFVKIGKGAYIPRLVTYSRRSGNIPNEPSAIGSVVIYKMKSFDVKPIPKDLFVMQNPPAGTVITDERYVISDNIHLAYQYSGEETVDKESEAQYKIKQKGLAQIAD